MGSYTRRLQAPTKERTADWIPEDGELFRDSAGNFYMGDNVTASNALTAIGGGVKRYVALLTQSGTDAPVATVLENSLGGTVVWTRVQQGYFQGTLTGAFPDNKTHLSVTTSGTTDPTILTYTANASRASDNVVDVTISIMDYDGGFNGGNGSAPSSNGPVSVTITIYP
jgi:hypothetical protein